MVGKTRTENVLAIGLCRNRNIPGVVCLYRAIQGRRGGPFPGHYRVWWVPGRDDGSLLYGPVEFSEKFEKIKEYKHDTPMVAETPRGPVGQSERMVLGEDMDSGIRKMRRTRR